MMNVQYYNFETAADLLAAWKALHAAGWKHYCFTGDVESWLKKNSFSKCLELRLDAKLFMGDSWNPNSITKEQFYDLLFKQTEPETRRFKIGFITVDLTPKDVYFNSHLKITRTDMDILVAEWTKYKEVHNLS